MAGTWLPKSILDAADNLDFDAKVSDLSQDVTRQRQAADRLSALPTPDELLALATPDPTEQQPIDFTAALPDREELLRPFQPKPAVQSQPSPYSGALTTLGGSPEAESVTRAGGTGYTGAAPSDSLGPIDSSSPDAFYRTAYGYAKRAEAITGVPAELSLAVAANETGHGQQRYMAGANNYHGIQAQPGEPGSVPYKDWRPDGQGGQVFYDATQRSFADPLAGFVGFGQFLTQNPRYAGALQRYRETGDREQLARDIHAAGYAEDPQYSQKIVSIMRGIPIVGVGDVNVTPTGRTAGSGEGLRAQRDGELTPNQFTAGTTLSSEDAYAACGPAAAIAFARANGRNPTLDEAVQLAREVGWTPQEGMAGPQSQVALLGKMGVAARLASVNPQKIAADVARGNPVIIDTPGHYFVAERYDPESGKFDFGNSAKALRASGGQTWFTIDEIERLGMGAPRNAIHMDSPESPSPSVVAGRSEARTAPVASGAAANDMAAPGGADAAGDPASANAVSGSPQLEPQGMRTASMRFNMSQYPEGGDISTEGDPNLTGSPWMGQPGQEQSGDIRNGTPIRAGTYVPSQNPVNPDNWEGNGVTVNPGQDVYNPVWPHVPGENGPWEDQPSPPIARYGTIKGGVTTEQAMAADRGRGMAYRTELPYASDESGIIYPGDEPLSGGGNESGSAPSGAGTDSYGPQVPYGVADNVEPGDFAIPGRQLRASGANPSGMAADERGPLPNGQADSGFGGSEVRNPEAGAYYSSPADTRLAPLTAQPPAQPFSDAVEPTASSPSADVAPASLGDQIKQTFTDFGQRLGDLFAPPQQSAGLAQAAQDIQQRQATLPGTHQAEALTQEPMPLDRVGQAIEDAGVRPAWEEYWRNPTVQNRDAAVGRTLQALPNVTNETLQALVGGDATRFYNPLGDRNLPVIGKVGELLGVEEGARAGIGDYIGTFGTGPLDAIQWAGIIGAAVDPTLSAPQRAAAAAIPLAGPALRLGISAVKKAGGALGDALDGFAQRQGRPLTEPEIVGITREWQSGEYLPVPELSGAPRATGVMPGNAAGIVSRETAGDAGKGIIVRPKGLDAQSDGFDVAITRDGHFYRGMTEDEYLATVGRGAGVKSTGAYSVSNEGTSLSARADDAESYVNFGRDDPRKTGRPTYLIEVSSGPDIVPSQDGYAKAANTIPPQRVTRVFRMADDGTGAIVAQEVGRATQYDRGQAVGRGYGQQRAKGVDLDPALEAAYQKDIDAARMQLQRTTSPDEIRAVVIQAKNEKRKLYLRWDPKEYEPGDIIPPSRQWKDGEPTSRVYKGTSVIDPQNERWSYGDLTGTVYDGNVYLVSGRATGKGVDPGEVFLRDPVVVSRVPVSDPGFTKVGEAVDIYRVASGIDPLVPQYEERFNRRLAERRNRGTSGTPGGLLPSETPRRSTTLETAGRRARDAAYGAVAGGYEESQQEGSDPGKIAQAALAGAVTGVGRGMIRDRVTPGGVARLARAVERASNDDRTHVRGFGIYRGVNDDARKVLEAVASRAREYPEGVGFEQMDDVIKEIGLDPDAVAKKWAKQDTRASAAEVEVLRRGAAATLQDFMDDARRLSETNDVNVLASATDRLIDAAVASEYLTGTRRAAESAGRTLNMFRNQIDAQQGRQLFESLERTAQTVERGARIGDAIRSGKPVGPRGATILEQAADAVDGMGKLLDDSGNALKRTASRFVDPMAYEVKVREEIKRALDNAIQKAINAEKRTEIRAEIQDMADEARGIISQIVANTSDQGLRDDLAEVLGRMREHSNVGEVAANRMQQVFDRRMDTWAKRYMDGVEKRIASTDATRQREAERFIKSIDTSIADYEAKQGKTADLEKVKSLRDQAYDLIKAIGQEPENQTFRRMFEQTVQDISTANAGGPRMATDFYNALDRRLGQVADVAQRGYDREAAKQLAEQIRQMAVLVRSGNQDARLLQGIDDVFAQMGAIGKIGRDRSTELKDALTRQGLIRFAGKLDEDQIGQFAALLKTIDPDRPETLARVMNQMTKGTLTDSLIEYAVVNMLSSPATQLINITSNAMQGTAALAIKHPLMVMLDPVVNRGNRQVYGSELRASAEGAASAITAGLQSAAETMRYGYSRGSMERAAQLGDFGGIRRELLTEKFGPWGAALHAISTRPLQAADELFGSILYSANLYTLAERRAIQTGVPRAEILRDLASHLDLVAEAGKMADYSLLKSRDRVTDAISTLNRANKGGKANIAVALTSHLLFPFVRTPWNVLKQGIEFSPIGTLANATKLGANIARGGDTLRRTDLASNVASGLGLATLGTTLWMGGNISGDGPTDPEKRRMLQSEGWQPRSIRVGGQWVSYDSTPFTIPLGSLVTGLERYQESLEKGQAKGSPDAMWQGVMGFGEGAASSFLNQSFVKNAADMYQGIKEGDWKPGTFAASTVSRYIIAGSMVAFLARLGDSLQRETRTVDNAFVAQIQERTPFRGMLPARQDVLGRAMPNDQSAVRDVASGASNVVLPTPRRSEIREDPVISAYQAAGVDIGAPPKQLTVDGIKIDLTPDEQRAWQRYRGDLVNNFAGQLIRSEGWPTWNGLAREKALQKLLQDANAAAGKLTVRDMGGEGIRTRMQPGIDAIRAKVAS